MNGYDYNPFQELYVTDSAPPAEFVKLFSDAPVRHAQALFQKGNVVLMGTQGCGKSMLLNLFRPEIRVAYHQAGEQFPVPEKLQRFVAAGVNLSKSGICDIGQIALHPTKEEDERELPQYFADFLNYWLVRDLLKSLQSMGDKSEVFGDMVRGEHFDKFASIVQSQDCWFGFLDGCSNIETLRKRIESRIIGYRRWLSGNDRLPDEFHNSKTAISEPIRRTVDCLKKANVIGAEVPVFVRIDQIEELHRSERVASSALRVQYRRVINRALGSRDLRVSYRVGTRRYCWEDDLDIQGSGGNLENGRDYRLIDMDHLFRRPEHRKGWLFPDFAADAFKRRIRQLDQVMTGEVSISSNPAKAVFGNSPTPRQLVERFFKGHPEDAEKILRIGSDWSSEWRDFLVELFVSEPLEALLAAAWGRQTGGVRYTKQHREDAPPKIGKPWNRAWWKKERLMQGALQLAARRQQRMLWWGFPKVLSLSGGNISIFLHICYEVWDQFLKADRAKPANERISPLEGTEAIDPLIQASAIHNASTVWHRKLGEQPGGDVRRRFIDVLGVYLRSMLLTDESMSYPGGNGFSLKVEDLAAFPDLKRFITEAVGYGDLYEVSHTTKEKNRALRKKYYISPILSPFYQLPEAHTKEPYYDSVLDILALARKAKIELRKGVDTATVQASGSEQLPLL